MLFLDFPESPAGAGGLGEGSGGSLCSAGCLVVLEPMFWKLDFRGDHKPGTFVQFGRGISHAFV